MQDVRHIQHQLCSTTTSNRLTLTGVYFWQLHKQRTVPAAIYSLISPQHIHCRIHDLTFIHLHQPLVLANRSTSHNLYNILPHYSQSFLLDAKTKINTLRTSKKKCEAEASRSRERSPVGVGVPYLHCLQIGTPCLVIVARGADGMPHRMSGHNPKGRCK